MIFCRTNSQTKGSRHQHTDNDSAASTSRRQRSNQGKTGKTDNSARRGHIAKGNQCCGVSNHHPGIRERDETEEKSNAGRDSKFEVLWDGVDQPFTNGQYAQDYKNNPGDKHSPQRSLPGVSQSKHDTMGKKSILAHARRLSYRVIRPYPHDQ